MTLVLSQKSKASIGTNNNGIILYKTCKCHQAITNAKKTAV